MALHNRVAQRNNTPQRLDTRRGGQALRRLQPLRD